MEISADHAIFWYERWPRRWIKIQEGGRDAACLEGNFLRSQASVYQIKQLDEGRSGDLVVFKSSEANIIKYTGNKYLMNSFFSIQLLKSLLSIVK